MRTRTLLLCITVTCKTIFGLIEFPIGVPMLKGAGTPYDIERVGPAIEIAVEKVNSDILNSSYRLKKIEKLYGDECSNSRAPGVVADMYKDSEIVALIGPACAYALDAVAKLASYWNIPIVTGLGDGGMFKNKTEYPTLTRLAYCQCRLRKVFGSIFTRFGWTNIAIVYDQNDVHSDILGKTLLEGLQKQQIFPFMFSYYGNQHPDFREILLNVKAVSRVALLIVPGDSLRQFMLEAKRMGFLKTGEFVFMDVWLFPFPGDYWGDHNWFRNDSNDVDARQAYESLIRISLQVPRSQEWLNFTEKVKVIAKSQYNFDFHNEEVNFFAGAFHDAILLYGMALNGSLEAELDPYDGYNFNRRMWNRTFPGITGTVIIDDNGDRDTSYSILDMNPDTGIFEVVADYWGHSPGYSPVPGASIYWGGGRTSPPLNEPVCGYLGDNPICDTPKKASISTVVVLSILSFLAVSFAIATLIYRHFQWEKDLQNMTWRINLCDVKFLTNDVGWSNFSLGSMGMRKVSITGNTSLGRSIGEGLNQTFAGIAICRGVKVVVHSAQTRKIDLTRNMLLELKQIRNISHDNLAKFIGACVEPNHVCVLIEYCTKGSLEDVINNESIKLDWTFRHSLLKDVVKGMVFLHSSFIKCHGFLRSSNCVVDSRFVVKITGFGLHSFYHDYRKEDDATWYNKRLWTAPEILRTSLKYGTKKGDVYSFAIIMDEVISRSAPFDSYRSTLNPKVHRGCILAEIKADIVEKVSKGEVPPFRPSVDQQACPKYLYKLIISCWDEDPEKRPDFPTIMRSLRVNDGNTRGTLMDTLLQRMEVYASNLEDLVEERTQQLIIEKRRSEELLYQILPKTVVEQLKQGEHVVPEMFEMVTIYFSDIVGFTTLSSQSTPLEIVAMLNDLYTLFDSIIDRYNVYKVETIGDAYMVASGLPIRNGSDHVVEICRLSLDLLGQLSKFEIKHRPNEQLQLRIGVHSGPCVAGVVGQKMPRYCLFGDTVNVASRMESTGKAFYIHISESTKSLLDSYGTFVTEARGQVEVKGKGSMATYWLLGEEA